MLPFNFTSNLSHLIDGVLFYIQKPGVMKVTFKKPLTYDNWQAFTEVLIEMIHNDYLQWEFHLEELDTLNSIDIGMWVMCNARIMSHSGKLVFLVKQNSNIHNILNITKIHEILTIKIV